MPGTLPERNAPVADSPISVLGPRPLPDHTIITGAAGWLGQGLCNLLTDPTSRYYRPTPITGIVRNSEEAALLAGIAGVTTVIGDVTDASAILNVLADADAGPTTDVIHTAGVIHPVRLADFEAINAGGTRNVVEAATKAGVRRMVHVSSNSPFGLNPDRDDTFRHEEPYRPYLGYGISKMRGELAVSDACRAGMLDAVIVRPPWFYGPWQPLRQTTFFKMVGSGRFPLFGGGRQRRSMVYIENLVQGIVRAELSDTEPGRAWWVADAQPYTVAEIVSTVQAARRAEGLASKNGGIRVPQFVAGGAVAADKLLQRFGKYKQEIHVLGEMGATIACDISVTRSELGYDPEIDLLEGMRRSIRWCQARGIDLG